MVTPVTSHCLFLPTPLQKLRESMTLLGFSEENQWTIMEIVAGILHTGNIEFKGSRRGDGVTIVNPEVGRRLLLCATGRLFWGAGYVV